MQEGVYEQAVDRWIERKMCNWRSIGVDKSQKIPICFNGTRVGDLLIQTRITLMEHFNRNYVGANMCQVDRERQADGSRLNMKGTIR